MIRDIRKAVNQYERMYDEDTGRACFYSSDFSQLLKLAEKEPDGQVQLFDLMSKCLAAGFAVGYRTAQRDLRGKRRRA